MRAHVFKNGYVYVYAPEHPLADNKGYYPEHILVAEQKLGRYLYEGEEVHHLDLNRANNRRNNLIVLDAGQHATLHRWLARGAPIGDVKCSLKKSARPYAKGEVTYSEAQLCKSCNTSIQNSSSDYCSHKCSMAPRRTEVSEKKMRKLMKKYNWTEIGRRLGVSDNGARKIAKRLGLL